MGWYLTLCQAIKYCICYLYYNFCTSRRLAKQQLEPFSRGFKVFCLYVADEHPHGQSHFQFTSCFILKVSWLPSLNGFLFKLICSLVSSSWCVFMLQRHLSSVLLLTVRVDVFNLSVQSILLKFRLKFVCFSCQDCELGHAWCNHLQYVPWDTIEKKKCSKQNSKNQRSKAATEVP